MTHTTKDSDTDYKESKVSDSFKPRFSYYSELIERPRKNVATCAKNSIFSALVENEGRISDDYEEEKRPAEIKFVADQGEEDSATAKDETSEVAEDSEISIDRMSEKEKHNNIFISNPGNGQ